MDTIAIPSCALHRQSTTVIVRMKDVEVPSWCQPEECPAQGVPRVRHRPSGCEQCSRTRLISQYSDCDSGIVEKCRPYKSSAARSRYVNVCAAVCLLLLIGGLSPRSCAAPYRSRAMDRQRRAADEENYLWRNPCSYNDSNSKSSYLPSNAKFVAQQANYVYQQTASYKDEFTKLHSFDTFENLLKEWKDDWLRNFSWFREEVLPHKKVLFQTVPDEDIASLMSKIDEVLPSMYKGLKMIVASLYKLSQSLEHDGISSDEELANNISQTMKDVRAVLCYFYDLMKARNLEILPVYDSEIPVIDKKNKLEIGLYIYRDTLNYLEYLGQVFKKMSETDLPPTA
ncbi:uncharacterized protein LOC135076125 isoform X1 [Ostrinia nubilalis]|uniref:uncharacterized protein LOC135076125 isoform X1 n=2 Tax=Ostrinia nubilalis TaxID=29057 RepID=UPI0030825CEC